jgi:hypothetical protein
MTLADVFAAPALPALIVAVSFAAGLNVAAPIATLGLLARFGDVELPPTLHLLSNWWVIGGSLAMFLVEFVADKIPAFDLVWNMLQTFVRVPVGALLAFAAASKLSPEQQLLATLAGGAIALVAHSGKTAARAAVSASPEPFSNVALSLGEDALAIFISWFATRHPFLAATMVGLLLAAIVLLVRKVARGFRALFRTKPRIAGPAGQALPRRPDGFRQDSGG